MGKKLRVKRGFVELRVMVDTQTMEMAALSVTDESVGDVTEFRALRGQSVDAIGAKGGAGDAPYHSKDPGPDTPAGKRGDGAPPPRIPKPPRVGRPAPRTTPVGPSG